LVRHYKFKFESNRGGDSSLSWLALATTENGESNITIVGDDSTGTAINLGEDFQIAGGTGITTAVSGTVLTVTASEDQIVNSLESSDSTEIIVKDSMSVQGTLSATSITGTSMTISGGTVIFTSLPTSDPGVSGQLYNDSQTLKVSAG